MHPVIDFAIEISGIACAALLVCAGAIGGKSIAVDDNKVISGGRNVAPARASNIAQGLLLVAISCGGAAVALAVTKWLVNS